MGGGAFYFLRIMSALYFQGAFDLEMVKEFSSLEKLGYFAVDRGNVPHIPIFMKIIDSWGPDIGYLYGRSFYAWVLSIVPTGWISPEEYLISLKINKLWFSNIPGAGGLPPTGVGEMYANFGVYGPFLGMFFFGVLCGAMYNFMIHSKSYWVLAIYSQILLGFILIYPKTDFANLSPWYIAPILATIFFLKLITTILRTN
jgi:oligosaccharide repeat unit polymerase